MGEVILSSLKQELKESLLASGVPLALAVERTDALSELLDPLNPTEVALKALEGAIYGPTRALINERFADRPDLLVKMLAAHGQLVAGKGLMGLAQEAYGAALEHTGELGPEHPDVVLTRAYLGILLGREGRFEESKAALQEVLEGADETLEPEDLAKALASLARAEHELRNSDEAHRVYERAIDAYRGLLAETGDYDTFGHTVLAMSNRSTLLSDESRWQEAEELLDEALMLCGEYDSEETLPTSAVLRSFARLRLGQKRYEESEELLLHALDISRREEGAGSEPSINAIRALAELYFYQERFEDSAEQQRVLIEHYSRLYGPGHPQPLECRTNLALVHFKLDDLESCIEELERADELARAHLDEAHPMRQRVAGLLEGLEAPDGN